MKDSASVKLVSLGNDIDQYKLVIDSINTVSTAKTISDKFWN